MSLISYENGKFHESQIEEALYEIGCVIDNQAYWNDFDLSYLAQSEIDGIPKRLDIFPFKFASQKVLRKEASQKLIDKKADFASEEDIIEVKSISSATKNIKQANEQLVGSILVEYKKYYQYLGYKDFTVNKENIYYVVNHNCDIKLIYSYLEDQKSWDLMKDRFFIVTPGELVQIFCDKINKHFELYQK